MEVRLLLLRQKCSTVIEEAAHPCQMSCGKGRRLFRSGRGLPCRFVLFCLGKESI